MRRRPACLILLLLATTAPAQTRPALTVVRSGEPAVAFATEVLAALPAITQTVGFGAGHADAAEWRGPLLWDVLLRAGVVDATKPAEQVRMVARVIGADGYRAVFALAELSPAFGGRPVQLALARNGQSLPDQALRLIAPGEQRAGRSVRDVVRVEVE